jgi:thromboxane-A synthase/cytochrome P450 family 3 subfamily A
MTPPFRWHAALKKPLPQNTPLTKQSLLPWLRAVWLTRHLPPYIPSLPFIGDLVAIAQKGLHVVMSERAKQYKGAPAFRLFVGSQVWIVTADPEAGRRVLNKLLNRFPFQQIARDESGLGGGRDLASLRGERWRRMRLQWLPTFAPPSLAAYAPLIDDCSKRLADRLAKLAGEEEEEKEGGGNVPQEVEVWRLIGALTLDVVGTCAFGTRFRALDDDDDGAEKQQEKQDAADNTAAPTDGKRLVEAARQIFASGSLTSGSGWQGMLLLFPLGAPLWQRLALMFPDRKLKELLKARKTVADAAVALVRQHRAIEEGAAQQQQQQQVGNGVKAAAKSAPNGNNNNNDDDGSKARDQAALPAPATTTTTTVSSGILPGSFLAQILKPPAARTAEPLPPLEELDAVAQSALFVLAGYETTANTVACAVHALSASPAAQRRLQSEVDAFFAKAGRGAALTPEAVAAEFPFADACVKEALRLYSPVTVMVREVAAAPGAQNPHAWRSDLLQGGAPALPPGIVVGAANWVYQRDPEIWPRAEDFLPERWVPEERGGAASVLGPSTPNAWAPFGGGPRACVGFRFALLEATVALVRLFERFSFAPGPTQRLPLPMKQALTLSPDGGVKVVIRKRGAYPWVAAAAGAA